MLYTLSREEIAEIYVATFNRAPDSYGLIYWANQSGMTIEQVAASFFDQTETKELYPDALNNTKFVNTIYNNVFDRDADPEGLDYWVDALDSGSVSRSDMILSIVNGASGTDQIILDNKTEVGLYFAQNGANLTIDQAYEVMEDVTVDVGSVADALYQVDVWSEEVAPKPIPPGTTMDLTTAIDIIEGSDINSVINGIVKTDSPDETTLNIGDVIDGGGGEDILKVLLTGSSSISTYIPNMSSVETLMIEVTASADQRLDLSGATGIEEIIINISGSEAGFTLTSSLDGTASLIDGSTSIGELTILGGVVAADGAMIIGGLADDTIDLSAALGTSINEVTGGEGADQLTASSGIDTFKYANTGDTGIEMETADTITSFLTGTDKISFEGIAPGSDENFNKAEKATSSFATAKIAADADYSEDVFDEEGNVIGTVLTGVVYSYQYDGGKTGYLFIDSDADGTADQVIVLNGLDVDGFNSEDIA